MFFGNFAKYFPQHSSLSVLDPRCLDVMTPSRNATTWLCCRNTLECRFCSKWLSSHIRDQTPPKYAATSLCAQRRAVLGRQQRNPPPPFFCVVLDMFGTNRGVTGWDGARDKKQVWRPHGRTWGLSEANWRK